MSGFTRLDLGAIGPDILTLTPDPAGAPIGPDGAGNINIYGAGGITTTGAGSTITISSTGTGITWSTITSNAPFTAVANSGYVANVAAPLFADITLPAVCAVGEEVIVGGVVASGGWQLNAGAGQRIYIDDIFTNIAGYVEPIAPTVVIKVVCIVANTTWSTASLVGNVGVF